MASIGVAFPAGSPSSLLEFVARIEALGYDEVWIMGGTRSKASFGAAAAALAATDRIAIGLGPVWAGAHNPVTAAVEISTLARLHPGRLTVAFGGAPRALARAASSTDPALEEVVTAVRMLLAGEVVNGCGSYVRIASVGLRLPPDEAPPIAISTTSRWGLGVAARRADAVVFPEGSGPDFIEDALALVSDRRPPSVPLAAIAHAWLALGEDGPARRSLAGAVARWVRASLDPEGVGATRPNEPSGPAPIPRGTADRIAIVGNSARCAAGVDRFLAAGVDRLILSAVGSELAQYEQFADEVMPLVDVAP
jgi:alkanesulfonate monooxygenase SsuD/methylene tetrahydromethanopterin reductase-like flavin-dependent oxidoreductase (luciferase family)